MLKLYRKAHHIVYFKFAMDSMKGNSAVEESSSEGGISVIQAANKLYSALFECCAERKKCVYCNKKIGNDLENPLTSEEAEKVPKMCPHHFKIGNPDRKYSKEPQDPQNICQACTIIFRNFLKTCHFSSNTPFRLETHNLRCMSSMKEAGRGFELKLITPAVPNKYVAVEIDAPKQGV
ncbi:Hypothetical predicted protein [Cloeon dipterum]|uniref:Uncharacterized protein n=1 Tax=Cloeon dipterum TaxID=197152 RepID=A0A8S1DNJ9_9INSE|nr:Hypothetical predicted protein [Cloeon dipterum]